MTFRAGTWNTNFDRRTFAKQKGVLQALAGLYNELEANLRGERYAVYADLQGGNIKFAPVSSGNSRGQISPTLNVQNVYSFEDQALTSDFKSFMMEVMIL